MARRSPESRARRAAYAKRWRELHPDYHPNWREEHKEHLAKLRRVWRRNHPGLVRAQRARERTPTRVVEELPSKFQGHPLFDAARELIGEQPYFDVGLSWEDQMAEAVLAMLEGRDPCRAARAARSAHINWWIMTAPMFDGVDVSEDGQLVSNKHLE